LKRVSVVIKGNGGCRKGLRVRKELWDVKKGLDGFNHGGGS